MLKNNQKIKLLQDLGMEYPPSNNTRRYRYGLYESPHCKKPFKTRITSVKSGHCTVCMDCKNIKHGESGTRLYKIWQGMKNRCYNPNCERYVHYGERGIYVCEEWKNNYLVFRLWAINNGYKKDLTIDRINNDGIYEPINCRWATRCVQNRNTQILQKNNTSGYRGVSLDKNAIKYRTVIHVNSIKIHIGYFKCSFCAAIAYDKYVIENNLEHTMNFN